VVFDVFMRNKRNGDQVFKTNRLIIENYFRLVPKFTFSSTKIPFK
jgi:hypothetical protein